MGPGCHVIQLQHQLCWFVRILDLCLNDCILSGLLGADNLAARNLSKKMVINLDNARDRIGFLCKFIKYLTTSPVAA